MDFSINYGLKEGLTEKGLLLNLEIRVVLVFFLQKSF